MRNLSSKHNIQYLLYLVKQRLIQDAFWAQTQLEILPETLENVGDCFDTLMSAEYWELGTIFRLQWSSGSSNLWSSSFSRALNRLRQY